MIDYSPAHVVVVGGKICSRPLLAKPKESKWTSRNSLLECPVDQNLLSPNVKVSDLIDSTTSTWNRDLVTTLFNEEDARSICSIPLSIIKPPDLLTWQYEQDGDYSVRSAYRMQQGDLNNGMHGMGSFQQDGTINWKIL
ncbi:hypothetical protein REPUB_Repub01dG0066000 [Reevesia pubescens]